MKDYSEKKYRSDFAIKMDKFEKLVLDIENANIDFFKSRPNELNKNDYDRIENHYSMTTNSSDLNGIIKFSVKEESTLTNNLKEQLHQAFQTAFE